MRQRDNVSEDRRSVMALLKSEQKHVQMMKNNLRLIRAQKILAGLMDRPKSTLKTAMSAHDLISFALELIDTLDDAKKIPGVLSRTLCCLRPRPSRLFYHRRSPTLRSSSSLVQSHQFGRGVVVRRGAQMKGKWRMMNGSSPYVILHSFCWRGVVTPR